MRSGGSCPWLHNSYTRGQRKLCAAPFLTPSWHLQHRIAACSQEAKSQNPKGDSSCQPRIGSKRLCRYPQRTSTFRESLLKITRLHPGVLRASTDHTGILEQAALTVGMLIAREWLHGHCCHRPEASSKEGAHCVAHFIHLPCLAPKSGHHIADQQPKCCTRKKQGTEQEGTRGAGTQDATKTQGLQIQHENLQCS